jgi:hypothetical protein
MAQPTLKTSHVIAISPVPWRADCCLATSYERSFYCCVTLSEVFIAPLSSYTRFIIILSSNETYDITKTESFHRFRYLPKLLFPFDFKVLHKQSQTENYEA